MALTMSYESDEKKGLIEKMNIVLKLPEDFPEKYKKAVLRAMDLCSVKRHMMHPPEFVIRAE
jgi:ribosomal protein S12 methylthiotransferase accessory factor